MTHQDTWRGVGRREEKRKGGRKKVKGRRGRKDGGKEKGKERESNGLCLDCGNGYTDKYVYLKCMYFVTCKLYLNKVSF